MWLFAPDSTSVPAPVLRSVAAPPVAPVSVQSNACVSITAAALNTSALASVIPAPSTRSTAFAPSNATAPVPSAPIAPTASVPATIDVLPLKFVGGRVSSQPKGSGNVPSLCTPGPRFTMAPAPRIVPGKLHASAAVSSIVSVAPAASSSTPPSVPWPVRHRVCCAPASDNVPRYRAVWPELMPSDWRPSIWIVPVAEKVPVAACSKRPDCTRTDAAYPRFSKRWSVPVGAGVHGGKESLSGADR